MHHECQLPQTAKVQIPPIVAIPALLFRKAYIDTMFMPPAAGFRYTVQARCSLTAGQNGTPSTPKPHAPR